MPKQPIAKNKNIDNMIHRCFQYITDNDAASFRKRFQDQPHTESQVMHTFRELILGAFLGSCGHYVAYERSVMGKTPDWSILDRDGKLECLVELINFHTDNATAKDINQHFASGQVWCEFMPSNTDRLYDRIREKASVCGDLATQAGVACIVAVFGDFFADVEDEEVRECLFDRETGLFALYPQLSGLLYFKAGGGRYIFKYTVNPTGAKSFTVKPGQTEWTF